MERVLELHKAATRILSGLTWEQATAKRDEVIHQVVDMTRFNGQSDQAATAWRW
jgi:hypothetical protein